MNSEDSAEDWLRMYNSLTDPEEQEKAKRENDRKERIEQRKQDTGYDI